MNSAEQHGILTSCGDLTELNTKNRKRCCIPRRTGFDWRYMAFRRNLGWQSSVCWTLQICKGSWGWKHSSKADNSCSRTVFPAVHHSCKYWNDKEVLFDRWRTYQRYCERIQKVIKDLYDAGCRNIQFDDCTWGVLVAEGSVIRYGEDADFKSISEKLLKVNNLAIEGKPDDLVINTHVCRGNYHSAYFSSGAYDPVAEKLFGEENVNAYYLEFDDERSGGFEPLKYVSGDKKVVLGLITTKSPVLEDKQTVINRIHEAAKYIPLDRLYLSPQCGLHHAKSVISLPRKSSGQSLLL